MEDKLAKLSGKVEQRNQQVEKSPRCQPEAGPRNLQVWMARHKLTGLVELRLEGRTMVLERNQAAIDRAMELAGCYVVVTDVPKQQISGQEVHDSYVSLAEGGAGLPADEDRSAGSAAGVCAQGEPHAGACVLLHAGAEAQPRDGAAATGGVWDHRRQSARHHLGRCHGRTEPAVPAGIPD